LSSPAGQVNGWAVESAAGILTRAGIGSFLVSAGGDIVGPDLGIADALATAVLAAGLRNIAWLANSPGYELLAVTSDRRILRSPTAPFAGSTAST
jgi:thiamine biosynthesis lipoprotein ApbE